MPFCGSCGSVIAGSDQFCTRCGTGTAPQAPPASAMVALSSPQGQSLVVPEALYHVAYSTGQVAGPFGEEAIKLLIIQQQLKIHDSIKPQNSDAWVPILQSKFGSLVTQQTGLNRLAANTCPRCSAAMAVAIKRSGLGLVLIIVGLVLTPAFGIGIPIWIIGFIIRFGGKGTAIYRCARCNYASQ